MPPILSKQPKKKRKISEISPFINKKITDVCIEDLNNLHTFILLLNSTDENLLQWLRHHGILAIEMICENCGFDMKLCNRKGKPFNKTWRCKNNRNHELSILRYSFFEGGHHPVQDYLVFIFGLISKMPLYKSSQLSGLAYGNTAVDWANFCREVLMEWIFVHVLDSNLKFQGEVQIDESLFGHKIKYHR